MGSSYDPLLLRTRLVHLATRRHEHLELLERLQRSSLAGAATRGVSRWLDDGPVVVLAGPGLDLRLAKAHLPVSHAQAGLIIRGELERPVQEAFRRLVSPGATVYDVGANIGFYSLLAARLAGPGGHVHAFEPLPTGARAVERNASLNGLETITVHEAAVGAGESEATLLVVGEASWSHLSSTGTHVDTRGEQPVRVVSIDGLVADGLPAPDVVKIDVEGAELEVLDGMERTLREVRPALVIELHETNGAVADRLESAGYRVENLDGPEPVRDAPGDVHVLARPA
jgi:FkbM family methyltransferase